MDDGATIRRVEVETPLDAVESRSAQSLTDDIGGLTKTTLERSPSGDAIGHVVVERANPADPVPKIPARRMTRRPLLFALLPVALAVGGYFYVTGGKVVSTDNAYVQADMVGVSTDVAGTVVAIEVHDNEHVKKGQVLYRLKQDKFQTVFDGAKAKLGTVRDQILTLQASYKLSLAQIVQAEADLSFYQTAFKRQQDLLATGAGTKANFDGARHDLDVADQKIRVAKAQAAATLAKLGGDVDQPLETNPSYLQAKADVDNAQRDFNDATVTAPFDGVVTNVNAIQVGSYLQASQQAFSLVSTTNLWVEANPKETELTNVRRGQPATLTLDTFPGVTWQGVVDSISPASSSSFSLLPAQNTTGNWVKVVQRIPMRVRIEDLAGKPPLRVGMSVTVDVDTGRARGLPEFLTKLFSSDAMASKIDMTHD